MGLRFLGAEEVQNVLVRGNNREGLLDILAAENGGNGEEEWKKSRVKRGRDLDLEIKKNLVTVVFIAIDIGRRVAEMVRSYCV